MNIHIVALAICPRCKSEVTEITDSTRCEPCEKEVRAKRNQARRARNSAMESCGLVRGKDSMGRTIWE